MVRDHLGTPRAAWGVSPISPGPTIPHTGDMNEHRPTVPPPPPPAAEPVASVPTRLRHPAALFFAAFAIGAAAAAIVGVGLGGLVLASASADCPPSDGWCGLGAAIMGLLVGVVTGTVAYIVAGVVTIYRSRPTGRRGQHVLAHIVVPIATYALLAAISGIVGIIQ